MVSEHLLPSVLPPQAKKVEDLGQVDLDAEAERRFSMVYVPNWFSIDLKTGVSSLLDLECIRCECEYKGVSVREITVSWCQPALKRSGNGT